MAKVLTQDSNSTGLRAVREATPGVLPGSPIWLGLEPNTYKDFGPTLKKIARTPINANRQLKKGVTTDEDVAASFQCDLTYTNFQTILAETSFFADFIRKTELTVATVDGTTNHDYEPASGGAGFKAGDLLFASGFSAAANNGLKVVTGTPGATSVPSSGGGLVDGATQTGSIVKVGHQFGSADATIVAADNSLNTSSFDMTSFGLTVGEWVFVGGDSAADVFANNSAFYGRVSSIAAHKLIFDKTEIALVDDTGTAKTIQIFFGRVIKNQTGTNIKKYTYQIERSLGFSDDSSPSQIQGEYLKNSFVTEVDFTFNTADKITFDMNFVAAAYEAIPSSTGLKAGTRPAIISGSAFNSSDNVRRLGVSVTGQSTPLFAFLSDFSIAIKNNITANKAVGTLGAISLSTGYFEVSTASTAYFADIASVQAIVNNSNVTIDAIVAINNTAIVWDLPLVALGDGKLAVAVNKPITMSLTSSAASGVDINANSDYTAMMNFFDYIPAVAEAA